MMVSHRLLLLSLVVAIEHLLLPMTMMEGHNAVTSSYMVNNNFVVVEVGHDDNAADCVEVIQ